ncbi:SRPBCC family protein [Natrononativus amylolyticus]|uniref:SRPBCC family protein n=1 Tax=Natrononativus amylolyticus TaxID=2963434 RepID=UPI0020CF4891|nr:SRPBCC domain-containing protein [Natrononativus amylolyticus]
MSEEDRRSKTEIEAGDTSLTIRRTFGASRERVYRAFADPAELEQWFAPGEMTAQVDDLELESDGALSLRIVDGKRSTTIEGTFLEVLEYERIVHTWQNSGQKESRVTYEFRDVDGGTEVVLVHERIGAYRDRSARENVDGYVEGWSSALETLGTVVSRE